MVVFLESVVRSLVWSIRRITFLAEARFFQSTSRQVIGSVICSSRLRNRTSRTVPSQLASLFLLLANSSLERARSFPPTLTLSKVRPAHLSTFSILTSQTCSPENLLAVPFSPAHRYRSSIVNAGSHNFLESELPISFRPLA